MKAVIVLDVDGVLADLVGELCRRIAPYKKPKDVHHWDLRKSFTLDEYNLITELMRGSSLWREVKPIEGAVEAVEHLSKYAEIVICSAPYWSCDDWFHLRRDWLKKHFKCEHSFIPTNAKQYVRGDVFIDDKPEHVQDWRMHAEGDHRAYLFDQPWNRKFPWPRTISAWNEETIAQILAGLPT